MTLRLRLLVVFVAALAGGAANSAAAGAAPLLTGATQHGVDTVLQAGQPGFSVSGTTTGTLGTGSFYGLGVQTASTSFTLTTTTAYPGGTLTQSGEGTNTGPTTSKVVLTVTGGTGRFADAIGSSTLYSTSGSAGSAGTPFTSASLGTITLTPSSRFTWAGPVLIAPRTNADNYTGLDAISCPEVSFCAVAGGFGDVVTSTNPLGGVWKPIYGVDQDGITAVSCPTARLCLAGDDEGSLLTSTDPSGGRSAWSAPVLIDPPTGTLRYAHGIIGLSCPSASLCVASDQFGGILTSRDPAGGAGTWGPYVRVDPPEEPSGLAEINGVSCPSVHLCVAVDEAGMVLWSRNPAGGATAWHRVTVESGVTLNGVSCASERLCVAVGAQGRAFVSGDPTGAATAWHPVVLAGSGATLQGVGCSPGRGLLGLRTRCAVVDRNGDTYTTKHPVAGAGAWRSEQNIPQGDLVGAACVTTRFCVGLANAGEAFVGAR